MSILLRKLKILRTFLSKYKFKENIFFSGDKFLSSMIYTYMFNYKYSISGDIIQWSKVVSLNINYFLLLLLYQIY